MGNLMPGRLFDLILFSTLAVLLARALLKPAQLQALHRLFRVLAIALLASTVIMVTLIASGWVSR